MGLSRVWFLSLYPIADLVSARTFLLYADIEKISNYSDFNYPIGFFSYIAGGFISTFDKQVASEIEESKVKGSGIKVATFIKMIEKHNEQPYSHKRLREIFQIGREIKLSDI